MHGEIRFRRRHHMLIEADATLSLGQDHL
jgi:hypothetical protein